MTARVLTWSCGGGTQSAAIAVLIGQRRLPLPEAMVMADTGREQTEVWAYLRDHLNPFLRSTADREIEVVDQSLATVGLYGGKDRKTLLIPAFTLNEDGQRGKLDTLCSNEWKKRVIQRWLRKQGYGPKRPVTTWIGLSTNEVGRAKPSGISWQEYAWPLLFDVPMTRQECRRLVENVGLPTPPRSSCWMCPLHHDDEWRRIRDAGNGDWERAVAFDEAIRARGDDGLFLHKSAVPLAQADLSGMPPQDSLFGGIDACDSGHCYV